MYAQDVVVRGHITSWRRTAAQSRPRYGSRPSRYEMVHDRAQQKDTRGLVRDLSADLDSVSWSLALLLTGKAPGRHSRLWAACAVSTNPPSRRWRHCPEPFGATTQSKSAPRYWRSERVPRTWG